MKRVLILLCIVLCSGMIAAQTNTFVVDGIKYFFEWDSAVYVSSYNVNIGTRVEPKMENYHDVTTIDIPAKVTYNGVEYDVVGIGSGAFKGAKKLEKVTIPTSIKHIRKDAFVETSLYNNPDNWPKQMLIINDCLIDIHPDVDTILFIPEGTRYIAQYVGYNHRKLPYVVVPGSVKLIDEYAFSNSTELGYVALLDGVEQIGFGCMSSNDKMTSIFIPNSVTKIGYNVGSNRRMSSIQVDLYNPVYDARNDCYAIIETATNTLVLGGLRTVIPNTVKKIGPSAFNYRDITSIYLPEGIEGIDQAAFAHNLFSTIRIPNSVKHIGKFAFQDCQKLKEIILGSGLDSIAEDAFLYCSAIESIKCHAVTPPTIHEHEFFYAPIDNVILYVPEESITLYRTHPVWTKFIHIKALTETGVEDIHQSTPNTSKQLRNGQVVIVKDGVEYNIMGGEL